MITLAKITLITTLIDILLMFISAMLDKLFGLRYRFFLERLIDLFYVVSVISALIVGIHMIGD